MSPIYVAGRISPVFGFSARRAPLDNTGVKNTGGLPPHVGSKRSKLNPEDSPPCANGGLHRYTRRPASIVSFEWIFQVSCTNAAQVRCRRSSGTRPSDSV